MLLLFVVTLWIGFVSSDVCRSSAAKVSVELRHNTSGHWKASVTMRQVAPSDQKTEPLVFSAEPEVSQCGAFRAAIMKLTLEGPAPPANRDYIWVPGVGYYKLHSEGKTWVQAKAVCENEAGHLAVVNSENEAEPLRRIIVQTPPENLYHYIGFRGYSKKVDYVTIYSEPLQAAGYGKWDIGQPDRGGDCGCIARNAALHDYACGEKLPFICEQDGR